MPCGVFTITEIPANQVGAVVQQFQLDGPTSVQQTQQSDGTFTVTATFPPCADGTTPVTVTPYNQT